MDGRDMMEGRADSVSSSPPVLSNAQIADRLASLAQLLSTQKENPYKVKAYQRAAAKIRNLSESLEPNPRALRGKDSRNPRGLGCFARRRKQLSQSREHAPRPTTNCCSPLR